MCCQRPGRINKTHTHSHARAHALCSPYIHAQSSPTVPSARRCLSLPLWKLPVHVFSCAFLRVRSCVHVSVSVCEPHSEEGEPFWLRSPPPHPPLPSPPGRASKKKERKGFPLPPSLIQTRLYFEMLALYNSWESANLARKARRRRICRFLPPQASLSLSLRPHAHSLSSAIDASPKMRRQAGRVA